MKGRPPMFNALIHDYEEVAEYICKRLRIARVPQHVYIDDAGGVRLIADRSKQPHRPDSERVGRYTYGAMAEQIEDDLIEWIRQNQEQRRTA